MERVRYPELLPLELSDVCVDGATLWEWSQSRDFGSALRKALQLLHGGNGIVRWKVSNLAIVAGFQSVFMTGGRTGDVVLRAELAGFFPPVMYGDRTFFGGEQGGFDLLRSRGLRGWVVDLGKSRLKVSSPEKRWSFPRDWTRLRLAGDVSPVEEPAQRRRLREFIALKLQVVLAESRQPPEAVVFALPAKLDSDCTPHSSNYAGMQGDRALLPEALEMARLAGTTLLVLNDAELAALSALADPRLAAFKKVLVLTLGFGIGAALIHRDG